MITVNAEQLWIASTAFGAPLLILLWSASYIVFMKAWRTLLGSSASRHEVVVQDTIELGTKLTRNAINIFKAALKLIISYWPVLRHQASCLFYYLVLLTNENPANKLGGYGTRQKLEHKAHLSSEGIPFGVRISH